MCVMRGTLRCAMGFLHATERMRVCALALIAVVVFLGMSVPLSAACDDHDEEAAGHEACPAAACCCASHAPALIHDHPVLLSAPRAVRAPAVDVWTCTGILSPDAPFQPPRA